MTDFKGYIAAKGRGETVAVEELNDLIARHAWFSTARKVREHITGEKDAYGEIVSASRGRSSLDAPTIDLSKFFAPKPAAEPERCETDDDIIDRFLQQVSYRIVADNSAEAEPEVVTQAEFSDEEDIVSEELAQIYMSQGLFEQAKATYRKLSLLNPEKSIYFAEIIDKIEKNN